MPVMDYMNDFVGELVFLGVNTGFTITFYYLAKNSRKAIQHLMDAPEIEIDANLLDWVPKESGDAVEGEGSVGVDACVYGEVKALGTTLPSVEKPIRWGVIHRHTIQEHRMLDVRGFWLSDKLLLGSFTSSVPFMLLRKGVGVQISEPKELEDVDLTVISEKFNAANNSFIESILGFVNGVRKTGTHETEEMLFEGTKVMGIGRLVMRGGELHLDPSPVLPYLLTTRNKKSVLQNLADPLPYLRFIGFITACGALYSLYRIASRLFAKWKRDRRRREEIRELEEARAQWRRREGRTDAAGDDTEEGEGRGRDLPESMMCVVCMGPRDVLFLPCRHICVCGECALRLDPRACPVCRTPIERIHPVFFS